MIHPGERESWEAGLSREGWRGRDSRGLGEGVGKVEALLASSMLGLMKERIPAEFLVWDSVGCLVLCLRPLLLEGKGGQMEAQCMVDCLISWKGRLDGKRPGTPA